MNNINKNYKIAIIGAGTIGLYLGCKMKEKGYNFSLFEKRDHIGTEICSGIFSEKIFDFVPESKNIVKNEIKSALLHFPKKTIELNFKKKFFVFSHKELDDILFSHIKGNVLLNQEILSIPNNFDKIIGCDGSNSYIRSYLKLKKPKFRVGIIGFLDEKNNSSYVETWPLKNGFIWKIPRGDKTEYGIMEKSSVAKQALDNFLKKNKIRLNQVGARVIPSGFSISYNKDITLCGDATGITKPWSGGGVIWGMDIANELIESFPDFNLYRSRIEKFKKKVFFYNLLTKSVYFIGKNIPFLIPKKISIDPDFIFKRWEKKYHII